MAVRNSVIALFAVIFIFGAASLFSQNDLPQRGSIPNELLRPRRDEAPRYPIDMVIGALGQGDAPREAYDVAVKAASAFLAGTPAASVFSSSNKVFIEGCMSALNVISPRYYRLGGGREEPDGSVSFLVRFSGRDEGITGEMFIRYELQPQKAPAAAPPEAAAEESGQPETEADDDGEPAAAAPAVPAPATPAPPARIWAFEDLILEEPRSREVENAADLNRFDFSPYERLY